LSFTAVSLHLASDDPAAGRAFVAATVAWFHRVGEVMSGFDPWSDISRWRRGDIAVSDCDPTLV